MLIKVKNIRPAQIQFLDRKAKQNKNIFELHMNAICQCTLYYVQRCFCFERKFRHNSIEKGFPNTFTLQYFCLFPMLYNVSIDRRKSFSRNDFIFQIHLIDVTMKILQQILNIKHCQYIIDKQIAKIINSLVMD